jgi:hypothetical protein
MPIGLAIPIASALFSVANELSKRSSSKSNSYSEGVETRPSSPVSVAPSRLTPLQSDLAYLLHDNDEYIYDAPTTDDPIPVTYIVNNLSEYGEKSIPLKVYVSALLRTWETAVLLYLPFLYNDNDKSTEYSQTLILEVSPFLLEGTSNNITEKTTAVNKIKEKPVYELNSNKPLDFKGNVEQFANFIKLLIYFKKQQTKFPTMGQDVLSKIPTNFSIILIAGNEKVHFRVTINPGNGTPEIIEYYTSGYTIGSNFSPNPNNISIPDLKLKKINSDIVNQIVTPNPGDGNDKYESYSNNRLKTDPPPQTIYTTFPMDASYFDNFENIGKFSPDIFSFLRWVIEIKSHPKNMPILFVSHSNTLREFLSLMVTNLNHDYENHDYDDPPKGNFFPPSKPFCDVCKKVAKTNTWSVRFTYLGYNVTGFRHAQSCDNIYKELSSSKRLGKKVLKAVTLYGVKAKDFYYREKYGDYTNLSLWGIFSTLIFANKNKVEISNFNDEKIKGSGLLVMSGMKKQTEENIEAFGLDNELTCGDISTRFTTPAGGGAGSKSTSVVSFTFNKIEIQKYVDIIPYSLPLNDISVTARQQMANSLCSYDNVFHITFERCIVMRGCSLSVAYIGNYNFGDITLESIKIVNKRRIGIRINESGGNINLVLSKVNPGGVVVDKSGNIDSTSFFKRKFLELSGKEDKTFTSGPIGDDNTKKIQLSDNFQKFVSFLLGLDVIQASVLTYDTLYNISIFYSNLLLRMLRKAYLLSSANESTDKTFSKDSIKTTKEKLGTGGINSDTLYGGKNSNESN